jgi:hypothetical protein
MTLQFPSKTSMKQFIDKYARIQFFQRTLASQFKTQHLAHLIQRPPWAEHLIKSRIPNLTGRDNNHENVAMYG